MHAERRCVVSSVLILLNNHVLHNGLPFPILLASCGQGASFIGALLLTSAGAFSLKAEIDLPFWASRCLPIGMASAGTLALGNIAYMHLSVSFIQMLKAGTPVVTMLVLFAARMEQPRRDLVLSILVITIGCALSTEGEIAFNWIGFCLMFLSELAEALKIVATQHLLTSNKVRFELHESLLYIAPAAFFWMLLSASALEIPRLVQMPYLKEQLSKNAGAVVLSGVLGFLVNLLTLGAIRSTSSLTFKVLGQGKLFHCMRKTPHTWSKYHLEL